MRAVSIIAVLGFALTTSGCTGLWFGELGPDKTRDRGIDRDGLTQMRAGIWVDPNGCDHWIIDDGVEGYLSQRLDPQGKPVCSGVAPPTQTVGDFKQGSTTIIGDPI